MRTSQCTLQLMKMFQRFYHVQYIVAQLNEYYVDFPEVIRQKK